jgi:hypothetical protein
MQADGVRKTPARACNDLLARSLYLLQATVFAA